MQVAGFPEQQLDRIIPQEYERLAVTSRCMQDIIIQFSKAVLLDSYSRIA